MTSQLTSFIRSLIVKTLRKYILSFKNPFAGETLIRLVEKSGALKQFSFLTLENGHPIQVDKIGAICRENWLFGGFERCEQKYVLNNFRDLDCCFDIGANCGLFSVLFLDIISNNGTIYSFEPNYKLKGVIQSNSNYNKHISIQNIAIGSENTTIKFSFSSDTALSRATANPNGVDVQQITLDHFVNINNIKNVDLIKIDVEEGELNVVKGMINILENMNPVLLIEISKHETFKAIDFIMTKYGYKKFQPDNFKKWNFIYFK